MADRSHEALTEQELRDLDAADGVIDGKVHGTDLRNFTHDATKSTREGEWEFRDGKYWRRDYYGAALPPKKVEVPPPREVVREVVKTVEADHSECRRLLEQKETLIRELHRLLAERDTTITTLKARIASLLATIEKLEIRITTLETELRTYTVQVQPAPIVVQEPNSYYVTRSVRGAELLKAYGKQDIVVGHHYGMYGHGYHAVTGFTPVVPSMTYAPAPVIVPASTTVSQLTVSAAPRTTTHTTVRESAHVRTGENEYYNVSDEAMRARLDAMDGVIDGKLNGVDIRLGGGAHLHTTTTERVIEDTHGREYYNVDSEAMRAKLDAMDGVIDGKFDGREINVRGGARSTTSTRTSTLGHSHASGREYYRADSAADAARLDAMDGVIDGRLHGTDIVTKNGSKRRK